MAYFKRERVYDVKTGNEVGYIETPVPLGDHYRVRLVTQPAVAAPVKPVVTNAGQPA